MSFLDNYSEHECFGYIATILGILTTIPQIYKIIKSKNVKSFSLTSLLLGMITGILWGLNSFFLKAKAGLISSSYFFMYRLFLIYAKLSFK